VARYDKRTVYRRFDRSLMGISLHTPNFDPRNTLQPDLWHWGYDSGRSWGAIPQKTSFRLIPQLGEFIDRTRLDKRASGQKQNSRGRMQATGGQAVQCKSPTKELSKGRPRMANEKQGEEDGWQALVQLVRPLQNLRCCSRSRIPPRKVIGESCTEDMECHAP